MPSETVKTFLQGNGVELSNKSFRVFKGKGEKRYVEGLEEFSTNELDWIYSGFPTEAIPVSELIRVVKPGGYVIIWDKTRDYLFLHKVFSKVANIDVISIEKTRTGGTHVVLQKKLRAGNILIVTAHLDDFVVWASTLVKRVNARFLVISAITGSKEYMKEFNSVIRKLQLDCVEIDGLSLGLEATRLGHLSQEDLKLGILRELSKWTFVPDMIWTHNRAGEYGHQHHKDVCKAVHFLFKTNVFEFDRDHYYQPVPSKAYGAKLDLLRMFKSQTEGFLLR